MLKLKRNNTWKVHNWIKIGGFKMITSYYFKTLFIYSVIIFQVLYYQLFIIPFYLLSF